MPKTHSRFYFMQASDLVHLGYGLMLCALVARDVLWLRAILVAAQGTLAAYAFFTDRPSMAVWNALFVVINSLWVISIIRERRALVLPDALQALHQSHFSALSASEFLKYWQLGTVGSGARQLTQRNEHPAYLFFLTTGSARVEVAPEHHVRLPAESFIGEMSFLTHAHASASVWSTADSTWRQWPAAELLKIQKSKPALWVKIQSVLGLDLVRKLQKHGAP